VTESPLDWGSKTSDRSLCSGISPGSCVQIFSAIDVRYVQHRPCGFALPQSQKNDLTLAPGHFNLRATAPSAAKPIARKQTDAPPSGVEMLATAWTDCDEPSAARRTAIDRVNLFIYFFLRYCSGLSTKGKPARSDRLFDSRQLPCRNGLGLQCADF
jgi:hypothetical protein